MFNRTGSRLSASLVLRVALFLALVYALWAFVIAPRNKNALSHVEIEPDIDPKQLKKGPALPLLSTLPPPEASLRW